MENDGVDFHALQRSCNNENEYQPIVVFEGVYLHWNLHQKKNSSPSVIQLRQFKTNSEKAIYN